MRAASRAGLGLAVVALLAAAGCRPAPDPSLALLTADAVASDLTLGPGDKFDIRVFGEPDFTGTYRVDPDGTIGYPFIGVVKVEGMRPNELARALADKLSEKYLRHPQVSILIQEVVSKKITVIGQVAHPGTFPYTANLSVVEAITLAGGFSPLASKNHTKVTRNENGQKVSIEVPAGEMGEGRAHNMAVRPGDIISVPERLF